MKQITNYKIQLSEGTQFLYSIKINDNNYFLGINSFNKHTIIKAFNEADLTERIKTLLECDNYQVGKDKKHLNKLIKIARTRVNKKLKSLEALK